jgi:phosphatidylglycerol---prolipoprotein diacylglyceryl transferase
VFPKLFHLGSYYLPTYGVLVALGFLTGLWVAVRLARRIGIQGELVTNLAVYCALAGLIGAKVLMIMFDWGDPQKPPIFSLATLQAAGVWQGGLLLAIVVAILYIRSNKLPLLDTFDAFAPGVAIGHAIGRIGCFAAGCCWGNRCDLPWAVTFHNPEAADLTGVPLGVPLHPSQIYEMLSECALFAFLYWRFGKPHSAGKIMGLYLVLSSAMRFLIEFTRFHEQGLYYSLSLTQWISIGLALGGVALLVRRSEPSPKISSPVAA